MKKTKKTKAKAGKAGKSSLLGGAAKSLKKLKKGSGLGKLSTTQKVVGGTALLALGLSFLTRRPKSVPAAPPAHAADASAAEDNLAALDGGSL